MDTRGRPRVIVNGVRRTRTFHYFWCQTCQRAVRIPSSANPNSSFCPFCSHQLRYELDITRPRLLMNAPNNLEPSPATQLMNSLALLLDPSTRERNTHLDPTIQWVEENEDGPNSQTWITLRFLRPTRPQRHTPRATDDTGNEVANFGDANAMAHNNRRGQPPAAASAIESLPTVKLTRTHLATDPNCPICKDEFRIDMEVKELPCKHFYHSDCIVPWLRIHNTCPICRCELQGASSNHYFHDENFEQFGHVFGFGFEDVSHTLNWLWSQLVSFRPLRAVLDWTHRHYHDLQENHGRGGKLQI